MKKITLSFLSILFLAACSSPDKQSAQTDSLTNKDTLTKAKAPYPLCFLNKQGKDSTSIELAINGNKVKGQMNWLPYQKDSRKGTIEGTITNDTIHATWSFMQEGMKDTLKLNFLFKNNQLSQKPLKLNVKTGREQTDESAGYSISYEADSVLHK